MPWSSTYRHTPHQPPQVVLIFVAEDLFIVAEFAGGFLAVGADVGVEIVRLTLADAHTGPVEPVLTAVTAYVEPVEGKVQHQYHQW